jgi:hypothetical protein
MIVFNKEIKMKIIPCIYGDDNTDSTECRYGCEISTLTGANERTVFMCAKYGKVYKNQYQIERLN